MNGLRTGAVLKEVYGLAGVRLPKATLTRWIRGGLVRPSIRSLGGRPGWSVWSAEDVIGLAWLARLRHEGSRIEAEAFRTPLVRMWAQLPTLLRRPGPLFFVLHGDVLTVMPLAAVTKVLRAGLGTRLCIWPLPATTGHVAARMFNGRERTNEVTPKRT